MEAQERITKTKTHVASLHCPSNETNIVELKIFRNLNTDRRFTKLWNTFAWQDGETFRGIAIPSPIRESEETSTKCRAPTELNQIKDRLNDQPRAGR